MIYTDTLQGFEKETSIRFLKDLIKAIKQDEIKHISFSFQTDPTEEESFPIPSFFPRINRLVIEALAK